MQIIEELNKNFKVYIGCKVIKAAPMDEVNFLVTIKGEKVEGDCETRNGYVVVYPDNYVSWSPKDVFETAYRRITGKEAELVFDVHANIEPHFLNSKNNIKGG